MPFIYFVFARVVCARVDCVRMLCESVSCVYAYCVFGQVKRVESVCVFSLIYLYNAYMIILLLLLLGCSCVYTFGSAMCVFLRLVAVVSLCFG